MGPRVPRGGGILTDPRSGGADPLVVVPAERYRNRELSWLDFNRRVLAMAEDERVPLLERAKFLAIFGQNLDEFFQVRVAGLKDQVAAGIATTSPDGRTAAQQLLDIRDALDGLLPRMQAVFLDQVAPALADAGIGLSSWADLDEEDEKFLVETFEERIFPVLTPLAVDPGHPFPYISNMSLNLAVMVRDPVEKLRRFARVKVPPLLPRFVVLPDGERYVPLEQVIAAHLDRLFPGFGASGAPRDRGRHVRRGARAAAARAGAGRRRHLRACGAARPGRAVGGARARPARPEGPAIHAGD